MRALSRIVQRRRGAAGGGYLMFIRSGGASVGGCDGGNCDCDKD